MNISLLTEIDFKTLIDWKTSKLLQFEDILYAHTKQALVYKLEAVYVYHK